MRRYEWHIHGELWDLLLLQVYLGPKEEKHWLVDFCICQLKFQRKKVPTKWKLIMTIKFQLLDGVSVIFPHTRSLKLARRTSV